MPRMVFELSPCCVAPLRSDVAAERVLIFGCKACSVLEAEQTDELECDHSSRVWAVRSLWW